MKRLTILLLVILFTSNLYAQKNEEAVISLTGTAKQYILPDVATINLTIEVENPDESKTLQKVQEITRAVAGKMKDFGFKKEQVKLTDFSLEEKYIYKKNEDRVKAGYIGRQTIHVKTPINPETISRLLAYIAKNKLENTSLSFTTELSPELEEKTRLQLIQKALQNAKAKADLMAKTAGIMIDGIAKIGYNEDESVIEMADSVIKYTKPVIKKNEEVREDKSIESAITSLLNIEEIELAESISVIYRITNGR